MRKFCQNLHKWISLPLGILFSVVCLSGAILVFEQEVLQMLNPQVDLSTLRKHAPERKELRGYAFFQTTPYVYTGGSSTRPSRKGNEASGRRW